LADIVTSNAFAYEIRFYLPSQVGAISNGVHQLSGSAFVTWKIESPDASTNTYNRLRITETRGSDAKTYDYTYTGSPGSWKLDYPGGLREDERTVSTTTNGPSVILGLGGFRQSPQAIPGFTRTENYTTRVPGGQDQFKVRRVYQRLDWGTPMVEETVSPDNNPQTTTYVYISEAMAGRRGQLLQKVIHPDGSWQWFTYDGIGHYASVYSSLGDISPDGDNLPYLASRTDYDYGNSTVASSGDDGSLYPDTPRCIREYQNQSEVSAHYTAFPSLGLRIDVQTVAPYVSQWDDPSSLFTTNRYYTSGPNTNRLKSVVRPDGTLETYDYAADVTGTYRTNMTASGKPDPTFSRVIDGTTNVSIVNLGGYPILSITRDVATGVILSQETDSNFDSLGRPQRVTHLDGTYEDTYYGCCGIDTTIDRDGVSTTYWRDAMKRQTATTRLGITTTNCFDAPGRVVKITRIGSDGTQFTQNQSSYDLASQSLADTNALGGATVYAKTTNSAGALVRTTTYPDGGTRIETYYRDGTLHTITGTAVHRVRYAYGRASEDGFTGDWFDYYQRYVEEVKLNADGSDTSEWTMTYTDAAGRPYKTIYSDNTPEDLSDNPYSESWYNNKGQLWKERDPDGVVTLHTFNAKGEPEYTITALSDDARATTDYSDLLSSLGTLKGGIDRVSYTTNDIATDHGVTVRRAQTYVWNALNLNVSTLVSASESTIDGLQSWQTQYRDPGTPVTSHSQTAYGANGLRTVTTTAPDNSYTISVYTNGQSLSVTRYDSSSTQIGKAAYGYDPHGRQSSVTDARNGATSYGFNAADLVTSVTTPTPGPGSGPQTTSTYYNQMLQATNVVNPDNTSVTTEYYLSGELKRQYGSRTYPVGYGYDYAGRMKTMTNWSGFAAGAGARVTTWNYSPYRGWLDNKQYPDGQGPSYAYTPAGRLQTRTWARTVSGQPLTTTYGFDNSGALNTISYSDSTPGITYTYDRLGRQATVLQNGMTGTFAYNTASELLSESYSGGTLNGFSVTNSFDAFLRRASLSLRNQSSALQAVNYGYDAASRLQMVADNTGATAYSAAYTYLANSPLVSQIAFKQATTTRMTTTKQYDSLNRLTSISSALSPSAVGDSYAYNSANQRIRSTLADGSYWLYEYDSLGQVRSGRKYWSDQSPVAGQQFEYALDDIGNRTQTKAGGDQSGAGLRPANYAANTLNQYTSRDVPGAVDIMGISFATNGVSVNNQAAYRKGEYFRAEVPVSNGSTPVWQSVTVVATNQATVSGNVFVPKTQEQFYYDADGNLTSDGRWQYTWDAENRLVGLTTNTTVGPRQSMQFEYDWQGRRIHKQVWPNTSWSGTPTNDVKFVYDGWNPLAELNGTNNAVIQSYVWGSDLSGSIQGAGGVGGLLFICDLPSAIGYSAPAFDGNGNVTALVSMSGGTNCAAYEYGPFGEVIRATGPMAKANPFRFSTKYQDDETDLVYYGYRFLNPSIGKWLSRDPAEEDVGPNLLDEFLNPL
jgi:RHS repeat-associated protein